MDCNILKIHYFCKKFAIYDWLAVIIVLAVGIELSFVTTHSNFKPYILSYVDFPKRTTTIPYEHLAALIFGPGSVIVIIIWISYESAITPMLSKCLAAYFFSISLTMLVESLLKQYIGRPRPDSMSVCQVANSSMLNYQQCSQVLSGIYVFDQFLSCPSGHSAESITACVFISLLLAKFFNSYNRNLKISSNDSIDLIQSISKSSNYTIPLNNENADEKNDDKIKYYFKQPFSLALYIFLQMIPIGFALYVCFSRIWDRVHHTDDVIFGLIIGILSSKITFDAFDYGIENREVNEELP